jgi:DNA-binding XRE family transcriptional regulator
MTSPAFPTFEAGGTVFLVVPATVAAAHGIGSDPAAERRRKLGAKLHRARVRAGLSQAELAARLGCGQPSVSAVEHGREPCSEDRAGAWLAACDSTAKGRQA